MIRDTLIPAVKEAFPDKPFLFSAPPNPIITLPSGFAEVGDLAIYDDGAEATICITEITHGHFNPYDTSLSQDQVDQKVTEDVIAFLRELFSDHVLLYRTPTRGMGGWYIFGDVPVEHAFVEGQEYFLWSGPYRFRKVRKWKRL
jgi:hypothetical protein